MNSEWWSHIADETLAQGDLLENVEYPSIINEVDADSDDVSLAIYPSDLIVLTQTCDLVQEKVDFVTLSMVKPIASSLDGRNHKRWNEVAKGRVQYYCLLKSPTHESDNSKALVVDFRQIVSLPIAFIGSWVATHKERHRLNHPYLEHFSQSLGRFFMRVGLPSPIPPFK